MPEHLGQLDSARKKLLDGLSVLLASPQVQGTKLGEALIDFGAAVKAGKPKQECEALLVAAEQSMQQKKKRLCFARVSSVEAVGTPEQGSMQAIRLGAELDEHDVAQNLEKGLESGMHALHTLHKGYASLQSGHAATRSGGQ